MDDPDLHLLTGAYAAGALSDDERRAFEAHLLGCDPCAQEVAELLATTAQLDAASFEPPPPSMRDAVLARIAEVPQDPPPSTEEAAGDAAPSTPADDGRRARRWTRVALLPAAAVAVVAALGTVVVATLADQADQADPVEAPADRLTELLAAPDAQLVEATGPDGATARVVWSAEWGEAVLVVDGMAPAPRAHTYELWLLDDAGARPAGRFDVDERGHATHHVTGDLASVAALGVTVEPEGGSPVPTTDPVMMFEVAG
jgi:anti-sigma-K factor RskA